ncbi:uncharacterized protein VTP21DRAFT_3059 [Calcarisporiella thermophila]|uniref:uncharacterized protein n=1 Tax=Calcarisporiella thermophila TaxID=911321 RepID=UPI003743AA1D
MKALKRWSGSFMSSDSHITDAPNDSRDALTAFSDELTGSQQSNTAAQRKTPRSRPRARPLSTGAISNLSARFSIAERTIRSRSLPNLMSWKRLSLSMMSSVTTSRRSSYRDSSVRVTNVDEHHLKLDLDQARLALDKFINSRMNDAEALLLKNYKKYPYSTHGYALLLAFRALITFQPDDIDRAIEAFRCSIALASNLRKSSKNLIEDIVLGGPSVRSFKKMTMCQRHAELITAEAHLFLCALIWLQEDDIQTLIRSALYVKRSQVLYNAMSKFVEAVEAEADNGEDISRYNIDDDFYSGVTLGWAIIIICLSYINLIYPFFGVLVKLVGFKGNLGYGLKLLEASCGWRQGFKLSLLERGVSRGRAGVRRPIIEGFVVIYHIIVSSFVFNPSFNLNTAVKVVSSLLLRYEHSVLFLYCQGKLHMLTHDIPTAIRIFEFATRTHQEWKQLHHVSYWDLFLCYSMLLDWKKAFKWINFLAMESMWSKATYSYHKAAVMYTLGTKVDQDETIETMSEVNHLVTHMGKICLPIEKFVARKARKFFAQGNRLFLPMFEIMYIWNAYDIMDIDQLHDCLDAVAEELNKLEDLLAQNVIPTVVIEPCLGKKRKQQAENLPPPGAVPIAATDSHQSLTSEDETKTYANYWDDYCLGYMLKGIIACKLAFRENGKSTPPYEDFSSLASSCFDNVLKHNAKIALDHYILYFTRFERARMLMYLGRVKEARHELNALKNDDSRPLGNGRYSFKNVLLVQIEHTLQELRQAQDFVKRGESNQFSNEEPDPIFGASISLREKELLNTMGKKQGSTAVYVEFFRQKKLSCEVPKIHMLNYTEVCKRYINDGRKHADKQFATL